MVHLHLHTSRGSLLDSILEIDEATNFAKENNQEAIALTDHGTMFSYVDFYKSCKKNNIKPIIGCEVYEVDDMNLKSDSKDNKQQRYHLILLVKNQKGLTNLYKLVSESYLKGFYTKPRIDLDYIQDNNLGEGIICLTACMAGRFSRIIEGKENKYTKEEYVNRLNKIFDYVALEIQSHPSELQLELNSKIVGFANRNDIPYVVTTDAHMLNKSQLDTHSIFVQIGSSREVGESYNGCYLQTDDEIHEYLDNTLGEDIVNKAIKETHNITSMIEEIDIGLNNGNLMPKIDCPKEFKDNFEYFNHIINSNFDKKFNYLNEKEKKIRRERLNMEIPILKQLEYIDYFLMLLMLTKEAKKRGIPLGYSRGSGANCLTLFVLGVTQIDSVRWNLDFSRFANLGRKSMADYDMDISQARRREMVTISEDLFGKEKVAPICTFNMLSTKVAIKDIGKVLDEKGIYKIPYNIRDEVSKLIPTIKTLNDLGEEEEKETLLRDVLLVNPRLKEINELYPLWFKYVMELEGKPKSLGRHACFTENELVYTEKGYKAIKDVSTNDKVMTHNNRFMPVVSNMKRKEKTCIVNMYNGFPIETTLNHPFFIRKKIESKTNKIKRCYEDPIWEEIKYAKIGDMLGIAINKEELLPESNYNLPFDSKDFWWTIGRYIGDGWTEEPKNRSEKRFIICCDKNTKEELNEIVRRINKIFNYRFEESRTTYKIHIKNKDLFCYVQQFGKYAHGKHLTNDILNLPIELLESFLDGYLSADGNIDKRGFYGFKTVSKKLAVGLTQCIAKVYHRHCSFCILPPKEECIEGRKVYSKEKYYIRFSKEKRKKEKSFYEDGYIWTRFKGLECTNEEKDVYNLTVLNDSSYTINNIIVHNCGTLIFPRRLDSYCPLCLDTDGNQMVQLEMHNAMDDLGMCKMDFLGLKNLDIIDECLKKSNLTWEDVDINHIDLNDKKVFDYVYKHGNTIGVFQMESAEAVKLCIEAETDNVEDVIAINAFNRPGTKAGFPTYVQNKKFPEKATILHDDLRDIFRATHLVLLYQEQALQLFRLAGFPEDAVDNARRSIGKKQKKVMESLKVDFSKGLKNRGWNDNQINEIWLLMLKQAEYSFNRGHSVAYGLLSYLTAYLKTYHPIEFMTACLNVEFGDTGKTGILINECNRLNIQVCPPNINKSMPYYTPVDNKILYGLNPIKGVGKEASNYIIKNRPYNNLNDFLDKVICSESCVNKTAIISLIKSGAIPTKNKNNTLKKYAEYTYKESEFRPVKTLPTKKKLYEDWGINSESYKSKEDILIEYNKRKEIKFNKEKENKKKEYLNEFKKKYVSNPDMYEFETLSMFLTTNPFKDISDELLTKFSDIDNKCDCVILTSIIDIKRKKDKRNNQFAYVDLYTCEGVIEGICWASCYNKYQQLIKKGNHLAMLGEKQDDKLIIKKIKTFEQWLEDIKHK